MKKNEWLKMKKNSFVEGTIIATIAIIIVKILGMLYMVPFYATVGSQGTALYGYAYNIYSLFLEISSAGLPIAVSKIINEYNTLGLLEAKTRTYSIAKKIITIFSLFCFVVLFVFAKELAILIIGDLTGGNTIQDVTFVIRCVSFALLVIPFFSVSKGYLQGHKYIGPSSVSLIIEQVVRIFVIIVGSYLALRVLGLGLRNAVGVAVFGAFLGGGIACLYILQKMRKNKKELGLVKYDKKDDVSNKDIIKKIIKYAIPFIIINITVSIYSFTNMVLILRTLDYLEYSAVDAEFITSAITTMGGKLNMIVGSLATGMSISLIPTIVSSFVKKDWKDVGNKVNKAFQMVLFLSIPMTVALSIMATPIWTAFYGVSNYGPIIFRVSIYCALFSNLYLIDGSVLQSLNKFKTVYISVIVGFVLNAILDIPLMLLFDYIGVYPFYGALLSTIIGYTTSLTIGIHSLKRDHGISFKDTFKILLKTFVPLIAMIIVLLLIKYIVPYNQTSRGSSIWFIVLNTVLGSITYLVISYKMKLIDQVFGRELVKKIIKKLTFGKVS